MTYEESIKYLETEIPKFVELNEIDPEAARKFAYEVFSKVQLVYLEDGEVKLNIFPM